MSMFMPTATGGPANRQDGLQCDREELNSFLPELQRTKAWQKTKRGLRARRRKSQDDSEVRCVCAPSPPLPSLPPRVLPPQPP